MDAQATFSCSFTQSDLGPAAEPPSLPHWPAQRLLPAAAGSGCPSARRGSSGFGLGPGT